MCQEQALRKKQFDNHNKQGKIIKIQCSFYVHVCVYVENTAMASWIKMIYSPMCACPHVGKVYWINVSIVGRSKKDKKMTLLTCVCMCVYVCDRKYGFLFSKVHVCSLWSLAMYRIPVVGKWTSHASSLCVLCAAICCLLSLPLSIWQLIKFLIIIFLGELKWIKHRIL